MTWAQDIEIALAQPAQAVEIAGERPGVGGDEDAAFAEHRVAGEAHAAIDQREVIGGVTGRGERLQTARSEHRRRAHVDLAPPRRQRRGTPLAQGLDPLGVVDVVVRERDPAEPATRVDGRNETRDVLLQRGTGIDHVGGVAADDPGVGTRQRQRAGILGAQAHDTVLGQPAGLDGGIARVTF